MLLSPFFLKLSSLPPPLSLSLIAASSLLRLLSASVLLVLALS